MSRSELFTRAVERWLADLEGAETTAAIDAALTGEQDAELVERAAQDLAARVDW